MEFPIDNRGYGGGDEVAMGKAQLPPSTAFAVGADRRKAAAKAMASFDVDVAVLDDGEDLLAKADLANTFARDLRGSTNALDFSPFCAC